MIKKIIAIALCLVLCVSCIALGVINQKADDTTEAAAAGAIGGAGSGAVENISTEDPATTNLLADKGNNLYELPENGTITITKANAASHETYKALLALLEDQKNGETAVTLDGKGCTIKTEIGLFKTIGNVTIKNLNIESVNEAGITVTNGDLVDATTLSERSFGVIACAAKNTTNLENVTVDVKVTCTENVGDYQLYIGAFVGFSDGTTTITNCTNNGDVTVEPTYCKNISVSGIMGYTVTLFTADNCINNGNLTGKRPQGTTVGGDLYIAGIAGCAYNPDAVISNSMNTGALTGYQPTFNHSRIGGIVGFSKGVDVLDSINLGNINAEFVTQGNYKVYKIGGIAAEGQNASVFTRCINAGNISYTAAGTGVIANGSGICAGWADLNYIECVNIGTISGNSTVNSGIAGYDNTKSFQNCYTIDISATAAVWNPAFNQSKTNWDIYVISVPNVSTLLENVKTKQVNNAKALIAAVLAVADYDSNYAHDKDDGIFLSTFDGFTIAAGAENGRFTTSIDKDFYEDVAAIAGSVEFGGIITLSAYLDSTKGEGKYISEFTHDAFDTYLEANESLANIESLYMAATFRDGRATQTLTDEELVGDKYEVNVTLKDANAEYTYTARAFIKIGEKAYIYSK